MTIAKAAAIDRATQFCHANGVPSPGPAAEKFLDARAAQPKDRYWRPYWRIRFSCGAVVDVIASSGAVCCYDNRSVMDNLGRRDRPAGKLMSEEQVLARGAQILATAGVHDELQLLRAHKFSYNDSRYFGENAWRVYGTRMSEQIPFQHPFFLNLEAETGLLLDLNLKFSTPCSRVIAKVQAETPELSETESLADRFRHAIEANTLHTYEEFLQGYQSTLASDDRMIFFQHLAALGYFSDDRAFWSALTDRPSDLLSAMRYALEPYSDILLDALEEAVQSKNIFQEKIKFAAYLYKYRRQLGYDYLSEQLSANGDLDACLIFALNRDSAKIDEIISALSEKSLDALSKSWRHTRKVEYEAVMEALLDWNDPRFAPITETYGAFEGGRDRNQAKTALLAGLLGTLELAPQIARAVKRGIRGKNIPDCMESQKFYYYHRALIEGCKALTRMQYAGADALSLAALRALIERHADGDQIAEAADLIDHASPNFPAVKALMGERWIRQREEARGRKIIPDYLLPAPLWELRHSTTTMAPIEVSVITPQ